VAKLLGMQVQACMIDLDGTLVDTMGDFEAVVALMLQDLGLPPLGREHLEGMFDQQTQRVGAKTAATKRFGRIFPAGFWRRLL